MNECSYPDPCKNPGPRGGLCKACGRARALAYYYSHTERMRAVNKAWREANPERNRKRIADWFEKNAEHRAAYLETKREHYREYHRARRIANPGEGTEYSREWRRRNPELARLKSREAANRRRVRNGERVSFKAILAEHGMVCHICQAPIADMSDLHFDHVIPLAKGGEHSADNIRPAHALCNLRKSDKIL